MPLNSRLKRSFVPLIAGAGILCAGLIGFALHNPDKVIGNSFVRVLARPGAIIEARWTAPLNQPTEVQLQPALNTQRPLLQNVLSVGDQIMLKEPDRSENSFRIVSVEFLNDTVTRIDTTLGAGHHLLITAQDLTDDRGRIIRFVLDIGTAAETAPQPSGDQIL